MKKGASRHPKMRRLARLLGVSRHEAVGLMHDLWEWAGSYTPQGDIGSHTNDDIADGVEWSGRPDDLLDALVRAGWVDLCDECRLVLHDWEEHCEDWIKKRVLRSGEGFFVAVNTSSELFQTTADNGGQRPPRACARAGGARLGKARLGKAQKGGSAEGGSADAPPDALAEVRRKPARAVCTRQQAETIYDLYPRKAGRRRALEAIQRAAKRLADAGHDDPLAHLQARVVAFAASPAGQPPPSRDGPDYRPHPETWFNGDRFDDDPSEWEKPNGVRNTTGTARGGAAREKQSAAERRTQQAAREYSNPNLRVKRFGS